MNSTFMRERNNYNAVDLFKFIAIILVVSVHTNPLSTYNNSLNYILVNILARVAVPFFFVSSGYFFYRKAEVINGKIIISRKSTISYLIKTIKIYTFWSCIYFIFILYTWIKSKSFNIYNITSYIWSLIFNGSFFHLWYLTALIFSIGFSYIWISRFSLRSLIIFSSILYIIGVLGNSYFKITQKVPVLSSLLGLNNSIFGTTRNGMFFGLLFVTLGGLISKTSMVIKINRLVIMFALSFILLLFEASCIFIFKIDYAYDMYFSLPLCVYCLFLLSTRIKLKDHSIFFHMRQISSSIYYNHAIFLILYKYFIIFQIYNNSLIRFTMVLASSITMSIIIECFGGKIKIPVYAEYLS